jgi:hypothetical protein
MAVLVAWVFFRAPDMVSALAVLAGMAGLNGFSVVATLDMQAWGLLLAGTVITFAMPNSNEIFLSPEAREAERLPASPPSHTGWSPNLRWGLAVGLIFALCLLNMDTAKEFIYAQF